MSNLFWWNNETFYFYYFFLLFFLKSLTHFTQCYPATPQYILYMQSTFRSNCALMISLFYVLHVLISVPNTAVRHRNPDSNDSHLRDWVPWAGRRPTRLHSWQFHLRKRWKCFRRLCQTLQDTQPHCLHLFRLLLELQRECNEYFANWRIKGDLQTSAVHVERSGMY